MTSLLFPLCTFFLLCLCIAYWASTAVYPFLVLFLVPLPPAKEAAQEPKVFQGRRTSYGSSDASVCEAAALSPQV